MNSLCIIFLIGSMANMAFGQDRLSRPRPNHYQDLKPMDNGNGVSGNGIGGTGNGIGGNGNGIGNGPIGGGPIGNGPSGNQNGQHQGLGGRPTFTNTGGLGGAGGAGGMAQVIIPGGMPNNNQHGNNQNGGNMPNHSIQPNGNGGIQNGGIQMPEPAVSLPFNRFPY